jgi:DNA-binding NarL/FixJ family response regulator
MAEKKLIIYTSSYLINKGFSVIIKDFNLEIIRKSVYSENELLNAFSDENFDYFVTDTKILNILQSKDEINILKKLKIIVLGDENSNFPTNLKIVKRIPNNQKKHEIHSSLLEVFEEKSEVLDATNDISEREREIVKYVALGFTNKEIAEKLFLSVHTVTTHRKNITNKLDIKTISGLTIYAILNGIISIDEK